MPIRNKDWRLSLVWLGLLLMVSTVVAAAGYWSTYAALAIWGAAALVGPALLYQQRESIRSEMAKMSRPTLVCGVDYTKWGFYVALVFFTAAGTAVLAAISGDRSATPFLFVTAVPNIAGLIVLTHVLLAKPVNLSLPNGIKGEEIQR